MPEPRTVKNQVHLDVRVGRGAPAEQRRQRIEAEAERLLEAGATVAHRVDGAEGFWLVLQDPEGNELCLT